MVSGEPALNLNMTSNKDDPYNSWTSPFTASYHKMNYLQEVEAEARGKVKSQAFCYPLGGLYSKL